MSDARQPASESGEQDAGALQSSNGKAKKPYEKPDFKYERVFETMALACGKLNPTQAQCHFNRKVS
jgi:hypothetical protein